MDANDDGDGGGLFPSYIIRILPVKCNTLPLFLDFPCYHKWSVQYISEDC